MLNAPIIGIGLVTGAACGLAAGLVSGRTVAPTLALPLSASGCSDKRNAEKAGAGLDKGARWAEEQLDGSSHAARQRIATASMTAPAPSSPPPSVLGAQPKLR